MTDHAAEPEVGGDHYRRKKFYQQHWDYTWERDFDQFQYNITKRLERWKHKPAEQGGGIQDLYKARQELDKYISLIEARIIKERDEAKTMSLEFK